MKNRPQGNTGMPVEVWAKSSVLAWSEYRQTILEFDPNIEGSIKGSIGIKIPGRLLYRSKWVVEWCVDLLPFVMTLKYQNKNILLFDTYGLCIETDNLFI